MDLAVFVCEKNKESVSEKDSKETFLLSLCVNVT